MIFIMLHCMFLQTIQLENGESGKIRGDNTNTNVNDVARLLDDFQSEKGACGQSQKQQKHTTDDVSSVLTIFSKKKAPAAALRHSKNEVHQSSPDVTGLHRTSPDFTGVRRNSREFIQLH